MQLKRISAITLRVSDMARAGCVLQRHPWPRGALWRKKLLLLFASDIRRKRRDLESRRGACTQRLGQNHLYVEHVDEYWHYLSSKGFNPPEPRDAEWGERYFHLDDPDGHELSFASH